MGMGITFLPGLYVRREIVNDPSLKVFELQGRAIYRTVGMAWRKSSARRESFEKLAKFFREAMEKSFSGPLPA